MKKTLLIITALLVTLISQAATIIVDNINDAGTGSLRQAATDAISGDTIRFNPSLLTSVVDSISLSTEINFGAKGIVIKGLYSATDTLFISGNNNSRIFSFYGAGKVVLDSLVLINGNGVGANYSGEGGAVAYLQPTDTLHISNSIIKGNTASNGGGVYSIASFAASNVNISRSTMSGNTAINGGGIYFEALNTSTVNISRSTISGNSASNSGGGILSYSNNSGSNVNISRSTISGNTASNNGGGVYSFGPASDVNISNSTLSQNTAFNGGGIYSSSQAASSVVIGSSIFEGSSIYSNGVNAITSQGYNIFTDAPTNTVATDNINIVSASINLESLAYNGGLTQTMLPGPNSIAIDMGNPADMGDAQNRSISGGIRDVGAAETSCITVAGTHNETVCFGDSIVVNGTVYNASNLTGTEVFTNVGTNNCDSTVTVNLTIEDAIDVSTSTNGLTIEANQSGATYQWIDCNNNQAINGATNANFTATADGIYAVVITVGNCSDTSDCVTISTASLEEQACEMNLSLFPNPATSTLTIENGGMNIKAISIVDVTGKTLETLTGNTSTIDVSKLNKGIYFLQIHTDKGLVSKKFIKK